MPREMTCPNGHKVSFVALAPGAAAGPKPEPPGLPQISTGVSALRDRLRLGRGWSLFSLATGRPVLMVGLLLVLLARGCDTVGNRSVQRASAKLDLAKNRFDDGYDTRRIALEQAVQTIEDKIDEIQKQDQTTAEDTAEVEKLREQRTKKREEISKLREDQQEKRQALERTTWRQLQIAARDAQAENRAGAYWREMLFVFGSIVLAFGLIVVSWTADGAERWICLIMLAIITFSLYVGGIAWIPGIPIR